MLVNANTRIVHLTTAPTDPKWNQNLGVLGSEQQTSVPASGSFCLTKARDSREEVKAERCEDIGHKAQNLIRDWNTSFLPPRSVLPVALTGYSASSWKFTGEVHQRLHLSWSGLFQTKFCEKSCVSQRWLVFNRFSLRCFSGQTAQPQCPVVSGRGHPPGLHQPQLGFSAACFFFPFRSFKRSYFCLLQNGKHVLKCQGFFTSDTSGFFSWLALYRHLHSGSLLAALASSSAENSRILHPTVHLESKHLANCTAASRSLICQRRVCINAANAASG